VLAVEILDRVAPDAEGAPGIERIVDDDPAGVERHGGGEALEGRAHLEDADRGAVHLVWIERFVAIVRVVVRQRAHAENLAGLDVQDDADPGDRVVLHHGLG
jgi:hypothetical protein